MPLPARDDTDPKRKRGIRLRFALVWGTLRIRAKVALSNLTNTKDLSRFRSTHESVKCARRTDHNRE